MEHDVFFIFVLGTVAFIMFSCALILFLQHYKRKQQMHIAEKNQMDQAYQNQILQTRLEVQEQSFQYFSEEIHDNIGQVLGLVKLQLYNIQHTSKDDKTRKFAGESTELLGKAINDLRNISHTMNGAFVSRAGLNEAIAKELNYIQSARSITCTLNCTGDVYYYGDEKEVMIFRIVQEAIANAIKHADATEITVLLHYMPELLTVNITDNGKGFDTGKENKRGGIGMNNMQLRANLLKGKLTITSAQGKGTSIQLDITNEHGN